LGSDPDGNLVAPVKINDTWHVTGDLNVRPRTYLKIALQSLSKLVEAIPELKLIVLAPIPRYVTEKCCNHPEHVKNFSDPGYYDEISASLERVDDLLTAWLQAIPVPSLLIDYRSGTDEPDLPVTDLTVGGSPVWQPGDPVHASQRLYSKVAEAICGSLDKLGVPDPAGAAKRPRLKSIVVWQQQSARKGLKPVTPQSWSAGTLPAPPKRGSQGGRFRGNRGWPRGYNSWRGPRGRGRFWAPRKY
jgi:hypothetical protein